MSKAAKFDGEAYRARITKLGKLPIRVSLDILALALEKAGVAPAFVERAKDLAFIADMQMRDPEMWLPEDLAVISKSCAVTAYNMKFHVHTDGRKRGLWLQLQDDQREPKVSEAALLEWSEIKAVYKAIGRRLPR